MMMKESVHFNAVDSGDGEDSVNRDAVSRSTACISATGQLMLKGKEATHGSVTT